MSIGLEFVGSAEMALAGASEIVVVGPKSALARAATVALLPAELGAIWPAMLDALSPGDSSASTSTWIAAVGEGKPRRVVVLAISERASRHNSPARPDVVAHALRGRASKGRIALLVALERAEDVGALAVAVARAFPTYHRKKKGDVGAVAVAFLLPEGADAPALGRLAILAEAVRDAARLVDMPPAELTADQLVVEAEAVATAVGATCTVWRRAELAARGLGGLVAVGQAARHEPALVHLAWNPPNAAGTPIAWIGKGIVYDTGGLSLKGKFDMPGMKVDMGGAAAVLMAFRAAALLGVARRIDAVLCIAENAIGPEALHPDDIVTLYSGKTIEINNTDAEGRLVLADGIAFAIKDLGATLLVDLATLTGGQAVATGRLHAAIVSNDSALEGAAVAAGRASGDLVFPLPYLPELFRAEFTSPVADFRNSAKDRANGTSAAAAQFVAEAVTGEARWLHVDMAAPVTARDRATGFGVALLVALADGPHAA